MAIQIKYSHTKCVLGPAEPLPHIIAVHTAVSTLDFMWVNPHQLP